MSKRKKQFKINRVKSIIIGHAANMHNMKEIGNVKPLLVYRPSTDSVEKKPDQPPNPFKKGGK